MSRKRSRPKKGSPSRWTRAELLAGYRESRYTITKLEGTVARRDSRIRKLEDKVAELVSYAAGLAKELKEARMTNSALSAENLQMEARGRGRAKRDGAGKAGGGRKKGAAAAAAKSSVGKKPVFTPLSHPHKGGPKPGEEGLPTVSEFLADPDRPADEEYVIDQKVCPVDGTTVLSASPVGSVEQNVLDLEVNANKVKTTKQRRWCPACKKIHTAQSPIALPHSRFSLRTDLFLAACKLSGLAYGKIRFLASSFLRIRIDEDDLVRAVHRVARFLGPLYKIFRRHIRNAKIVHIDETSWWVNGVLAWLWDFVTEWTVVIAVAPSRGGKVAREYLGEYEETLIKDSYGGTNGIGRFVQVCLQHLLREIYRTLVYKNPGREFRRRMAPTLTRILRDAISADRYKSKRKRLECKKKLEARVDRLIRIEWTDPDCRRFAKRLKRERGKMFTFLAVEGAKWHNNDAERPFRPSASIRKVSGGNRSWEGAEAHSVLQSVDQTCKARGLDFCGSVARYLTSNAIVKRVKPAGRGRGRAKKGGAMRMAWPILDGPTVGDLTAPAPPPPSKPEAAPAQPPLPRRRSKPGRRGSGAGRAKASR